MQEKEQTSITPGVLHAIITGFDLTAKHLWLLLIPVALDLFFWLGPRLTFQTLIERLVASLPQEADLLELAGPLLEAAPLTNLFTVLSVPFVGVPTLMAGLTPETLPIEPLVVADIDTWGLWLLLLLVFGVVGLLITAVFYLMIAAVVSPPETNPGWRIWVSRILQTWRHLLVLALLFIAIAMAIYLPISLVGGIAFMFSPAVGTLILLAAPFIIIWIVIYFSMTPQIILLDRLPALGAVRESARFVQRNMLTVLLLLLIILLVNTVVDWLLVMAENGTWLTIINLLGHAFISTALTTAVFVFYRDRSAANNAANLA